VSYKPSKAAPVIGRSTTLFAVAVLAGCSLLALGHPFIPWDSWWYHLPFSSRLWNIGGGGESFHLSPMITARWLGFPKAWEWIQGLFWAVTGTLYSIIVPQLLLCGAYFAYVSRAYRVPLSWIVFAFFASPMLFIHYQATYLDLPSGLCIALGFLLAMDLLERVPTDGPQFPRVRAAACIACLGLAGNIKFQSLLIVLVVVAIAATTYLFARGVAIATRVRLLATLAIATLIASASAIKNEFVHDNPLYPLAVTVRGIEVLRGPQRSDGDAKTPAYRLIGERMVHPPGPINFILSATELDWTLRGVPPWYSIDAGIGMSPTRRGTEGSRTGGWGGVFFIFNACLLALQILRLRREPDRTQRLMVVGAFVLLAVTSALPSSHELRYWLYVPLVLIPVNLRYLAMHRRRGNIVSSTLAIMMVYGVVCTVASPESGLFSSRNVTAAHLRTQVPPAVVKALQSTGRYCYPTDVSSLVPADAAPDTSPFRSRSAIDSALFRYSRAVTGLHGMVSGVASDCAD
jgi:hypothetical protein